MIEKRNKKKALRAAILVVVSAWMGNHTKRTKHIT
jgi:hypothetical protein